MADEHGDAPPLFADLTALLSFLASLLSTGLPDDDEDDEDEEEDDDDDEDEDDLALASVFGFLFAFSLLLVVVGVFWERFLVGFLMPLRSA